MSVTVFTEDERKALERKSSFSRFLFLPGGLWGLWMIAHPWPIDHWAVQFAWVFIVSYCLLCWTSCFHETAHQTLCPSPTANIWLGRLLGMVMFVPYTAYRETHIRHHAYLNKPTDWELWPYSDPNSSLWFRRVFVWLDLIFGFVTAPYIYGRIYFHRNSPLRPAAMRRAIRWEYVLCTVFWGSVLTLVAWYGAWRGILIVWCLPHLLAGIWQNGRKLTEHLGMASYDPLLGTRTVIGSSPLTRLGTYLNFDIFIHGPHHRHPRMAHNQLQQKMSEYLAKEPQTRYPVYTAYWKAAVTMLPWLVRNPGVGMNVGAPPPRAERLRDVDNFVSDVNRDILPETETVSAEAAS